MKLPLSVPKQEFLSGARDTFPLLLGALPFGIRYFLFALADRIRMAPWIEGSLKFIPPAVLTAITLPAVLLPKGDWQVSFSNPYLVSAIVATAAGILTRNLLATIAIGLSAFFSYRYFL